MGTRAPDAAIARAFDEGQILRTHVMRPTWHFVTPDDIVWMLELTAPRVHQAMSSYNRRLGLDAPTLVKGAAIVERALGEGRFLTRADLREHLARAGLPLDTVRLAHLVMYAEQQAIVCSGPRRGKQFTYALVADRAAGARRLPRDEALGELARRYIRSHGPATLRDFVWWSGLRTADARRGLEIAGARPLAADGLSYWTTERAARRQTAGVHLLPIYDEYLVAYRDRIAVPHGSARVVTRLREAIIFQHALLVDGQVAGTWRTADAEDGVAVNVYALRRLGAETREGLRRAARRYGRFLGKPVTLTVA